LKARIESVGYSAFPDSPAGLARFIAGDTEKWARVIRTGQHQGELGGGRPLWRAFPTHAGHRVRSAQRIRAKLLINITKNASAAAGGDALTTRVELFSDQYQPVIREFHSASATMAVSRGLISLRALCCRHFP
jgi:hypothetical protein